MPTTINGVTYIGKPIEPRDVGGPYAPSPQVWAQYYSDLEAYNAQQNRQRIEAEDRARALAAERRARQQAGQPGVGTPGGGLPAVPGGVGPSPTGMDYLSAGNYNPLGGGPAWAPSIGGSPTAPGVPSWAGSPAPATWSGTPAPSGAPNYASTLPGQALSNIQNFLSRNPDTREWDMTSAEKAVAGGVGGSRMAAAEGSLLRQSEIDKRNKMGMELLEPYLTRQQQTWDLIERGRQAKDLLRLSESGQMERLNAENKARLEQIAAQGANALAQTRLAGEFSLNEAVLGANTSRRNALLGANTSRENALLAANTSANNAALVSDSRKPTAPSSYAQNLINQILSGGGATTGSPTTPTYPAGYGAGSVVTSSRQPDDYNFDSNDPLLNFNEEDYLLA